MHIVTEAVFDGRCEEAFRLYERTLGGKIVTLLTWANSPMAGDVHTLLMGGDVRPEQYERPKGFQVMLNLDDPAEADRIFQALSDGATTTVPMQKTFWALRFGALIDRFGIPWSINCEDAQ